ncbi:MAG: hypothetical protein JWN73_2073 [Betaproteobacteria bacterium]|nr:hypothetical protein [Betaproteobacteria bacterium]
MAQHIDAAYLDPTLPAMHSGMAGLASATLEGMDDDVYDYDEDKDLQDLISLGLHMAD